MRGLLKGLRIGCLYPSFFLVFFLVGLYWTFPYDHVRDYVIQEAERGGALQLDIGRLSPSWVTGVHLEDVTLAVVPEDPETPPRPVTLPSVDARISLFGLLGGTLDATFDARVAGGGRVEGRFAQGAEQTDLDVSLSRVDLARLGPLHAATGVPLSGRLSGELDLHFAQDPTASEGEGRLRVRDLVVSDGESPIPVPGMSGGLTLAPMDAGDLELRITPGERGRATVERLHADGPDVNLRSGGTITLVHPPQRSILNLLLRVEVKEAYRSSNDRMRVMFSLLQNNGRVRPFQVGDFAYQLRLQGSPAGRFRPRPAANETPPPE